MKHFITYLDLIQIINKQVGLFINYLHTFTSTGATPAFLASIMKSAGFPCITPFG